ncbi:MAG: RIP metalloprotease RseP [Acidobacteriota bacterium]|nr:RIP metalloprotease RseP [Acidobacteriota bacterium]
MGIVAFVIVLCAMVVIHEFGHFIVAKMLGIGVEVFSVGFGPRLFGFKYGETDYRFSAVPLGGYVRFRGENLEMLQGKSDAPADEFNSHPKWKRFLVALAGPAFNIATALLIPTIGVLVGFHDSASSRHPVVGYVQKDSAAQKAGLQPGDKILAIEDNDRVTWNKLRLEVILRYGEPIPLKIERNGQVMNVTLTPTTRQIGRDKIGEAGMEPNIPMKQATVNGVEPGKPGALAGMQSGDKIIAVNKQPLKSWSEFKNALQASNGQPVTITVERDSTPLDLTATPALIDGEYRLAIGINIMNIPTLVKTSSLTEALYHGWDYNWDFLRGTAIGFRQIFNGSRSVRDSVQGPVGMLTATVETYNAGGWSSMIGWMGFLSLNLGIFNLLPIPVLDGGMILMLFVEGLMGLVGWTMTMKLRERIQTVGLAIVGVLIIFVFGNDFLRLGENYFSKKSAQPAQVQQQSQPQQQAPAQATQPEQSPQPAGK